MAELLNKIHNKGELHYLSVQQIKKLLTRKNNFKSFIQ
jgi:hypothetical protein